MTKRRLFLGLSALLLAAGGIAFGVDQYLHYVPDVVFKDNSLDSKLLLREAKFKESNRIRTLDGKGGALDVANRADGFVVEDHFIDIVQERRSKRLVFFPAETPYTKTAEQDAAVPITTARGPLESEFIYAASGFGLSSEQHFDKQGNLLARGYLSPVKDAQGHEKWFYTLDTLSAAGIPIARVVNDMGGKKTEEDKFYPDGAIAERKLFPNSYSKEYYDVTRYAADGKTATYREKRVYGEFDITEYYPSGQKSMESMARPSSTTLIFYEEDGRRRVSYSGSQYWGIRVTDYDKDGKPRLERSLIKKGTEKRADGTYEMRIEGISVLTPDNTTLKRYTFDKEGRMKEAFHYKGPGQPRQINYQWSDGVTVMVTYYKEDGTKEREDKSPSQVNLRLPREWFVLPDLPKPPTDRIDVDNEIPHHPGQ